MRAFVLALLGLVAGAALLAGPAGPDGPRGAAAEAATTASTAATATTTATTARARTGSAPAGHVVLVGVPALTWDEIDEHRTPNLWRLARAGAAGALSVRTQGTVACPQDGWLTVSAGTRAARPGGACATPPPAPTPRGAGAVVTAFPRIRQLNIDSKFEAPVGLLGETVRQAGGCTLAAGAGAALAAADARGAVDLYAPSAAAVTPAALARCAVGVVAVDDVLARHDVRAADAAVGHIRQALPPGATMLVAGLTDDPAAPVAADAGPHLRVAIAAGPEFRPGSLLTSSSTRRPDIVLTPDVTATMLHVLGLPIPADALGEPWRSGAAQPGDAAATTTALADQDVAAQTIRWLLPRFFTGLVLSQVLFYGAAVIALRRDWGAKGRRRVLAATRVTALACAAVPVSTYLANLVPWWTAGRPLPALLGCLAAADALVVAVALAGPWRRTLLGPGTVVAAATAATIALDLLSGTPLQLNSLMGYSPLVGGRYYGLGNIAFSVFATSTLLASVGLAQWLIRRGGASARAWALAVVVVLGLTTMALDGLPLWGADFGGVIAFVPGLAVSVLVVAGKRISLVRLAAFCAAGGAAVLAIAFLDHLRPAAKQTHLGRFFGDLLHGSAGPVVERKFGAMVHTFGNMTLTPIVVAGLVLLFVLLRRPDRLRAGALDLAFAQAPLLRAGLMGALLTAVVGTLVNDSGVAVLALGLVVGVPIALAAGVRALENGQPVPATGPSRPSGPAEPPAGDAAARPAPSAGEAGDPVDSAAPSNASMN
ncbi:MAG TPA: hypothetical protein VF069_02095 [Streptosporangiaceae bacterium]